MMESSVIRIPPQLNVPLPQRVRRIIDLPAMRRLARLSQLGMVSLVYPGATHSRWEHSLGVYYEATRLLARFADHPFFEQSVDDRWADAFLLAALVHDVGHWPFCHPIEDMQIGGLPKHESRIEDLLAKPQWSEAIGDDWRCGVQDVVALLHPEADSLPEQMKRAPDRAQVFFTSCLSGPVDVDKLDYLQRDSLHAGVPYGRNFDADRLTGAMTVHPDQPRLAIGEKGKTAAEMMVFARYVMFSEVYWHRTVRAATAMLQRAVFLLQNRIDLPASLTLDDSQWIDMIRRTAEGSVAGPLVEGLFGNRRRLYKRAVEFDVIDGARVHAKLCRRPYWYLVAAAESVAESLAGATGLAIHPADVLIDAPPMQLEVDINMDVVSRDGSGVRPLGEVSPVASALAREQFDNHVKRVRVFLRDDLRDALRQTPTTIDWEKMILHVTDQLDSTLV